MSRKSLVPFLTNPLFSMSDLEDFFKEDFFTGQPSKGGGVSVYEDEKKVHVEASVPGLSPEDIEVTFEKGLLWIRGEKKEEEDKKEGDVKYHTRASTSFSYRVYLPTKVEETSTPEAVCEKGVVKISFAKAKTSSPQKITVK